MVCSPQKPPDDLPGSGPSSPEAPLCTSLSRKWSLSQGQVALFVCPWLGPPWQHCLCGLLPSGREVPGSWAAALSPWASCKGRTFYIVHWHVFWPPTFWKQISLSVGSSTYIHYSFKKLAEYIQQHQHQCQHLFECLLCLRNDDEYKGSETNDDLNSHSGPGSGAEHFA